MAQVTVTIDRRSYEVACSDGQEEYLAAAAEALDAEARAISDQIGQMAEARTLLMAGLMVADRFVTLERRANQQDAEIASLRAELAALRDRRPERAEVLPDGLLDAMDRLAQQAEYVAETLEQED